MHRTLSRAVRRLLSDAVAALAALHARRPHDEPRPEPSPPPPAPTAATTRSQMKMAYRMNAAAHRNNSGKPGKTDRSPLHDCAE